MKNKDGIAIDVAGWWILAIIFLVIILGAIGFLFGWWEGTIDYVKNFLRFRK